MSGYDYLGVGGINPLSVKVYLNKRFNNAWGAIKKAKWKSVAKKSRAVITLFKWPGLAAHYVAGIKTKKGTGKKFRFYNSFPSINGKKITMNKYISTLKANGCTRLYLVGVSTKKGW